MKTLIAGLSVGIANIIPGLSGGSMLVIFRVYDQLMNIIADFFKFDKQDKIAAIKFLILLLIGLGLGLVLFANIMVFLLTNYVNATMWFFISLILFSYPMIKNQELGSKSIRQTYFLIGFLIMLVFSLFDPANTSVVTTAPELTMQLAIVILFSGFIAGATMIIPGISGSLVMLIIGIYPLFNYYVANVFLFEVNIIVPLILIAIGVLIAIFSLSKIINKLLKSYHSQSISLILGLVIGSVLVLIPPFAQSLNVFIESVVAIGLGGLIIILFNKMVI